MPLYASLNAAIPEETLRVARAMFPKGNIFMRMHDTFGAIYSNPQFAALFSHSGHLRVLHARELGAGGQL